MKPQIVSEIKSRFEWIEKNHLKQWDANNPEPVEPFAAEMIRELEQGKGSLNAEAAILAVSTGRDCVDLWEILRLPCYENFRRARENWQEQRRAFECRVRDKKFLLRDGVLMANEDPVDVLQSFSRATFEEQQTNQNQL